MTTPTPRCAVVIPTYNCGEYLRAALDSVAAQNVPGVEVIVVDDGSTDATQQVLADAEVWFAEFGALRAVRTQQIGPGLARNLGVEMAQAPLIAFLDADDVWLPGKLQAQIEAHEADPSLTMSFTDYRHRGPDGEDRGGCFAFWRHQAWNDYAVLPHAHSVLLGSNLVGTSTVVVNKDAFLAVGGFAGEMPSSEDWDVWLKLARNGPVARSAMIGCDYLMRPNSLTAARGNRIAAMEIILARAIEAEPKPDSHDVRLARARIMTARAELYREQGEALRAAIGHLGALALAPSARALRSTLADLARWSLGPLLNAAARRA